MISPILHACTIIITIFLLSCESYNVRPSLSINNETGNDFSKIVLNYKFDFEFLQSRNLKNPIIKSLKKIKFKEIIEIDQLSSGNSKLEIKIKYLGPFGTGIEVISAITLGIIPTYFSELDLYGIKLVLYNYKRKVMEKEYILRMKQFNWIFVAPAAIGNSCRRQKIIDSIIKDFFSYVKM